MERKIQGKDAASVQKSSVADDIQFDDSGITLEEFWSFVGDNFAVRYLSLMSFVLVMTIFILQLSLAWNSYHALHSLLRPELSQVSDRYLDQFYEQSPESWHWDPERVQLRVNTSLFVL